MAPDAIGTGTLERLSALPTGGGATLSVYLDLERDALRTPAARDCQLRALSTEPALACARADIEQVRDLVATYEVPASSLRGIAIFSCSHAGILEVLRLPCRVEPLVVLDTSAWLEPLVDMVAFGHTAVVVLGPDTARLLRGSATILAEFGTLELLANHNNCQSSSKPGSFDDPYRAARRDVSKIAEQLLRAHRRRALTDLVIIAPGSGWLALDAALDPELRAVRRVVINADLTHASTRELAHVLAPMLHGAERASERAALISLKNAKDATGYGLTGAFAMLEQRRVQLLLIAEGARLSGGLCRQCRRVSTNSDRCDFDGTGLVSIDAVAHAIELATAQDAGVMVIRHERDTLLERGAIATLARQSNENEAIRASEAFSLPPASPTTRSAYQAAARWVRNTSSGDKRGAGPSHKQPTYKGKDVSWLDH